MKRTPIALAATLAAGALVASGCGSSDGSSTSTTRAASGTAQQYVHGKGDGLDASKAPINPDAEPPLANETDAQLAEAATRISTFPTVLDPRLWDGEQMKPDIRAGTLANVKSLVKRMGINDVAVDAVELFGSNASYEYDDKADFGVHVFLSSPTVAPARLDSISKLLSSYTELKQEGRIFYYGVPLEVTFHGTRGANYEPKKGIGQYSVTDGAWVEKPTQQPNRFNRGTMATDARGFVDQYNALVKAYVADKKAFDCDRFGALDDEMKAYRNAGLNRDGSRSTENLTYRALRRLSVNVPDMVDEIEDECNYIQESLPK